MIIIKATYCCGVRPDLVAMSTTMEKLREWLKEDFNFVWTGQHYSENMSNIFFQQLKIQEPKHRFEIRDGSNNWQTGQLMIQLEDILKEEMPNILLSFSDANACQSAIVAKKMGIKVAHFESGMRSFDARMCEELNRRMVDSISDYFFTPTNISRSQLLREGIKDEKIFVVGKQIIDVIEKFKAEIDRNEILKDFNLLPKNYFLAELHRPELVENPENLANVLKGIKLVYEKYGLTVIAPLHKRTQTAIKRFNLQIPEGMNVIDSIGFFEFENLTQNAFCCISDSGTIQETACWYRTPSVCVRPSTERWETIQCGSSLLAGNKDGTFSPVSILRCLEEMIRRNGSWMIPYATGATEKIVEILKQNEESICRKKVMWDGI